MNIIIMILASVVMGVLIGLTSVFAVWVLYSKYQDKKLKKEIVISDMKEAIENTKPMIDERGLKEDEYRRIEKIRQFEKLRRNESGEFTVEKSNDVFTGINEYAERTRVSNESFDGYEVNKRSNRQSDNIYAKSDNSNSKSKRIVRLD